MSWERVKSLTTELPPKPSIRWWFLTGVLMAIAGILLFMINASGMMIGLTKLNIWLVSLAPSGIWFILLCLRGWLWDKKAKEHAFLKKEAEHAQKKWEAWSERYLIISACSIVLPDRVTAEAILISSVDTLPCRGTLTRRLHDVNNPLTLALASLQSTLCQLPCDLPVKVTLVTDLSEPELPELFASTWTTLFPQRDLPENITLTPSFSIGWAEERLKQPTLTVDLILVMQLCGGDAYSDGLAALLLTSDDVSKKYRLPHPARLLRPMPLNMDKFEDDFTLFLETQTAACRTAGVLGDSYSWETIAAPLMIIGIEHGVGWDPTARMLLEKWCGIPGPAAPWLLIALAADLVSLGKTSLLTLFSSGEERFISTVTPGSENEHIG
ncbi:type VI secretion protein [Kosakonia sp.]|uniref:type VI secretion protein n=1 Tax=Kosakonia sp. TaxID=1916651 RepID=UPI00289A56D8|nr:type VI secretion protein [Kosakonia sp.]